MILLELCSAVAQLSHLLAIRVAPVFRTGHSTGVSGLTGASSMGTAPPNDYNQLAWLSQTLP